MSKWTKEQLTCTECAAQGIEFVAKDMRGLNGHRMFKHSVRPSAPQLPLKKQDLLISESRLEQLLDARFAVISGQVDALSEPEQQKQLIEQMQQQLKELDERLELALVGQGVTEADKEHYDNAMVELAGNMDILTQRIDKIVEQENSNTQMLNENFREWGNKVYLLFQALDKHTHSELTGNAEMDSEAAKLIDTEVRMADKHRGKLPEREEPATIEGKTDRPGYKFLPHLNLSVREK